MVTVKLSVFNSANQKSAGHRNAKLLFETGNSSKSHVFKQEMDAINSSMNFWKGFVAEITSRIANGSSDLLVYEFQGREGGGWIGWIGVATAIETDRDFNHN